MSWYTSNKYSTSGDPSQNTGGTGSGGYSYGKYGNYDFSNNPEGKSTTKVEKGPDGTTTTTTTTKYTSYSYGNKDSSEPSKYSYGNYGNYGVGDKEKSPSQYGDYTSKYTGYGTGTNPSSTGTDYLAKYGIGSGTGKTGGGYSGYGTGTGGDTSNTGGYSGYGGYGGGTGSGTAGKYGGTSNNYKQPAKSNTGSSPNKFKDNKPPQKRDDMKKKEKENFQNDIYDDIGQENVNKYANLGKDIFSKVMDDSDQASAYNSVLTRIQRKGGKFTDDEFPPNVKSLVGENKASRYNWTSYKWIRPCDFLNTNQVKVFEGAIEPNDIKQGFLGDCYFLSTLAALAEWPQRIAKLFLTPGAKNERDMVSIYEQAQATGCYFVNMCCKGEWKQIIMDDFMPCLNKERGPAFTRSNGPELWVMLLEKAWSKVYGSYDNIEAGLCRECLHDLTGAPSKTIWTDEDHLWPNILRGEKKNYAMTCGTKDFDEGQDNQNDMGVVSGHAYSLLGGYEVNYQGGIVKLVKLRNPWGDGEWTGKWSDNSSEWNRLDSSDKSKLHFDRKDNDGIFFMEYSDFQEYFDDCQFCLIHDDFKYISLKANCTKKNGLIFKMKVPKKGVYFLTINQKSKRHYSESMQDEWEYPNSTLVFGKKLGKNKYKYIEGQQKADRECWTAIGEENPIEEGEYIIYAKVAWNLVNKDEFVLSCYGEHAVKIEEISRTDEPEFLMNVYLDHAKNISKRKKDCSSRGESSSAICIDQTDDGYAYMAAWNNSKKNMNVDIKIKKLGRGMKLKTPYNKQGFNLKLQMKPGEEKIALIRMKSDSGAMSYSHSIDFN